MIRIPTDPHPDRADTDAGQVLDLAPSEPDEYTVDDESYSVDEDGNVIKRWSAVAPREAA